MRGLILILAAGCAEPSWEAELASNDPRVVPIAIAAWLWAGADGLPPVDLSHPGAEVFEVTCAPCHGLDGVAAPVDVDVVGTDPAAADSSTRGTGRYRVPSLRGVGQRAPLLHDGSVRSLEALLDPQRDGGHTFGHDLPDADRALLESFLLTL
ncbi:MAG: mono/diheme cytochrome c family protein [Myxococcota bacterium]